jgi:7-cyano-7-deazaguanine reductase
MNKADDLSSTFLGKETSYAFKYDPSSLDPIPRSLSRKNIGLGSKLPFQGFDIWNSYELSWLNPKGLPQVALLELWIPCESECLIESKSLKIYLNSFNNSYFKTSQEIKDCIKADLEKVLEVSIECRLKNLGDLDEFVSYKNYDCLDQQDITASCYQTNSQLIKSLNTPPLRQKYYSELLRSCCPVTGQPDWATIFIDAYGPQLCKESLLQYLVSFRNTQEFHEACVERVFVDLCNEGRIEKLCVYARYTRRGGIDINPLRFNFPTEAENDRTHRQ